MIRSSHPEMFLGNGVLKICGKFTGEHPCRSVISIKLLSNFIEIALRHGRSPVNLLHIFRTAFPKEHLWTSASVWSMATSCCGLSRYNWFDFEFGNKIKCYMNKNDAKKYMEIMCSRKLAWDFYLKFVDR